MSTLLRARIRVIDLTNVAETRFDQMTHIRINWQRNELSNPRILCESRLVTENFRSGFVMRKTYNKSLTIKHYNS
jgi:hypothetical protein